MTWSVRWLWRVCAVLAGAKSFTAIGEWAADAPPWVLLALGAVLLAHPAAESGGRLVRAALAAPFPVPSPYWGVARVRRGAGHGRWRVRPAVVSGR